MPGSQPRRAVSFSRISLVKRGKKKSETDWGCTTCLCVRLHCVCYFFWATQGILCCVYVHREMNVNVQPLAKACSLEQRGGLNPSLSVPSPMFHCHWVLSPVPLEQVQKQTTATAATWTARSRAGFFSSLSQNSRSLPSALKYLLQPLLVGNSKRRRLLQDPIALEWPGGAGHCPGVGFHTSLFSLQVPPRQFQCILPCKTPPGSDTYPQSFRLPHSWAHAWPRVSHNRKREIYPLAAGLRVPKPHLCFYVCVGVIQRKLLVKRITIATFNRHPACKLESGKGHFLNSSKPSSSEPPWIEY